MNRTGRWGTLNNGKQPRILRSPGELRMTPRVGVSRLFFTADRSLFSAALRENQDDKLGDDERNVSCSG
jgi:hypothetical protein